MSLGCGDQDSWVAFRLLLMWHLEAIWYHLDHKNYFSNCSSQAQKLAKRPPSLLEAYNFCIIEICFVQGDASACQFYPCWGRGGQAVLSGPSMSARSLCSLGVCMSVVDECEHSGGGQFAPMVFISSYRYVSGHGIFRCRQRMSLCTH